MGRDRPGRVKKRLFGGGNVVLGSRKRRYTCWGWWSQHSHGVPTSFLDSTERPMMMHTYTCIIHICVDMSIHSEGARAHTHTHTHRPLWFTGCQRAYYRCYGVGLGAGRGKHTHNRFGPLFFQFFSFELVIADYSKRARNERRISSMKFHHIKKKQLFCTTSGFV